MVKCVKHKRKAIYKWQICSIGKWEGVCPECDLELNKIALQWRYPRSWKKRFEDYKRRASA